MNSKAKLTSLICVAILGATVCVHAQENSQQLKIKLHDGSLVVDGLRGNSRNTVLLWRQYHLENGGWLANCVPVGAHSEIPLGDTGLVVKGAISGLGRITIWLAPTDAPYALLSNRVTSSKLVAGVEKVPHYIDTGTKYTFTDTDGVERSVTGNFTVTSNEKQSWRQFTGKTEDGMFLGGSEIAGKQYVGVYKTMPVNVAAASIRDARNPALRPITGALTAHHRKDGAALIEVWNKPTD